MEYPGFVGPSDKAQSIAVNDELTINFYTERQRPSAKAGGKPALYGTPGLTVFATLTGSAVRATFEEDGRAFAICDTRLYEVFANGTATQLGTVASNSTPATICSNGKYGGHQLFIVSGLNGYIFDLNTSAFGIIADGDFPNGSALMGQFIDQYFIVLTDDGTFQICTPVDGDDWSALDIATPSQSSDAAISLLVNHREVWLFGGKTTGVWYNSGNVDFPFEPIQGVFIQKGIRAKWSAVRLDNSIMWLGREENGGLAVYRAQQFTPVRVSTPSTEYAWSQYSDPEDARAWVYEENGHTFYHLYFPSAVNATDPEHRVTWVYDVAENVWTCRAHWDTEALAWVPHVGQCHMYAFGKHLVGDRQSGILYHQSLDVYDEELAL
jgi:hypothetical protein